MNLLVAIAFASLIALTSSDAFTTVAEIQQYTVGSQTGMCGQHMVRRLHVERNGQKFFVFVGPDTQRIVIATIKEVGPDDLTIGTVTYAEVGPGGKLKMLDTHEFGERDAPGPCLALYPEGA